MADKTPNRLAEARALYAAGDYAGALHTIAQAQDTGCISAALLVLKARALQLSDTSGPINEVSFALDAALSLEPENIDALLEYGWFLLNVLDDPAAASLKFRESLTSLRVRNTDAQIGLIKCAHESGATTPIPGDPAGLVSNLINIEEVRAALAE